MSWNAQQPINGGRLRFRERLMFPVVDFRGEVTGQWPNSRQ